MASIDDIFERLGEKSRAAFEEIINKNPELREELQTVFDGLPKPADTGLLRIISKEMLSDSNFNETAKVIFETCKERIGATAGYVALLSPDGSEHEVIYIDNGAHDCKVDPNQRIPVRGLKQISFKTGKVIIDNDFQKSEFAGLVPKGHVKLENVLFAPLIIDEKPVGLLGLCNKTGGFTDKDAELTESLANFAAVSLKSSRDSDEQRKQNALYVLMSENIGVGVAYISPDMKIFELNPIMQSWFPQVDVSRNLTCYESFNDPPKSEVCSYCPTAKTLQDGKKHEAITDTPAENGLKHFRVVSTPVKNYTGRIIGAIELVEDLTDKLKAERALRESEELNALLFESVQEGIIVYDTELRYIRFNKKMEEISGMSSSEVLGKSAVDLFPHLSEKGIDVILKKALNGEKVSSGDIEFKVPKTGKTGWVNGTYGPLRDYEGKIIGVVGIVRDVTERKIEEIRQQELEAQIRKIESLQAIGKLAAGIAHDYNNTLTIIKLNAALAASLLREGKNDDAAEALTNIGEAADGSAQSIKKLLEFARKRPQIKTDVNVHDLIKQTCTILKKQENKRITIEYDLIAEYAFVTGDKHQLESAILNIGLNGLDAIVEAGILTISTKNVRRNPLLSENGNETQYVCIEISDTGSGMDAETMKHVFEPFFTTKKLNEGTGLGLASAYGTIESHDGFIEVKSQVGKGSTFYLYLPVTECMFKSNEENSCEMNKGTTRIMIVDDEDSIRNVLKRTLERKGYDVIECSNGKEAVDYFVKYENLPRLIIMDLKMPVMDGLEALRSIRSVYQDVKVLMSTGLTAPETMDEIEKEGVEGFLDKPYDTKKLAEHINRLLC